MGLFEREFRKHEVRLGSVGSGVALAKSVQ